MQLGIRAGAREGTGIEDVLSGREQLNVGADGDHGSCCIPSEHVDRVGHSYETGPDLRVDGIHRDGLYRDEEITRARNRRRCLDFDEWRAATTAGMGAKANDLHGLQSQFIWAIDRLTLTFRIHKYSKILYLVPRREV